MRPARAAYRAINTMDAMVGRRDDRYGNFGWAAARLDDIANYVPARIFAGLVVVLCPHRAREIIAAVRRDAPSHPSPNAGVAEAALAAALGRRLGGPLRYGDIEENRPLLGDGPRPDPDDVGEAVRIADRAEWAAVGVLCRHRAGVPVEGARREGCRRPAARSRRPFPPIRLQFLWCR